MLARPSLLASVVCALFFLAPSDASAQEVKTKKSKEKEKSSEVGDYDGVQSGSSRITPPGAKGKSKGKNRPVAYWVGFVPRDGGDARVFVQLGTNVDAQQWVAGNSLVVHLPKIRIGNRTVSRFLDTRFFDTAVKQVRVKNTGSRKAKNGKPGHGSGLQLHIDFKNPADVGQASLSVQTEADGYNYLYLDFGAGTELPEPSE